MPTRQCQLVRVAAPLAAILAGASAAPADATVLIQNTAAAYTAGGSTFGSPDVKAYLFTTGSTAFDFGSIEILLTNGTPGTPVAVAARFEIRAVSGGLPGGLLASSAMFSTSVTQQYTWQTFTLTSAFTLAANTSYALVMTGSSLNNVKWGNTDPFTEPTGSFGYAVSGALGSSDGGSNWSSAAAYNAFVLNGVPSVVPGGGGAALLATLILPARRRRR